VIAPEDITAHRIHGHVAHTWLPRPQKNPLASEPIESTPTIVNVMVSRVDPAHTPAILMDRILAFPKAVRQIHLLKKN